MPDDKLHTLEEIAHLYATVACYRATIAGILGKKVEVKCDYCGKMRSEEKTLELDDGTVICVLCLAGEVEHAGD